MDGELSLRAHQPNRGDAIAPPLGIRAHTLLNPPA